MSKKPKRFRKRELNRLFLNGLGEKVIWSSSEEKAPLLVDFMFAPDVKLRIRVYLFNLTNPPGGRAPDEYKAQIILPGQKKGEKASLDYSEGRLPILAAYIQEGPEGVFVLWDADKHDQIAFSSNIQVKAETIIMAAYKKIAYSKRANDETIVAVRPQYLFEAIKCRISIMEEEILRVAHETE